MDVLAGFRVPVPRTVAEAASPDTDWSARLAAGEIRAEGDTVLLSPLLRPATVAPEVHQACYAALAPWADGQTALPDALRQEWVRLGVHSGHTDAVLAPFIALVRSAHLRGTAGPISAALVREGLFAPLLAAARQPTLSVMVDGGRFDDVAALLTPEEAPVRARDLLRRGRPAEALETLAGNDAESALLRARAHLNSGRPRAARAHLPSEVPPHLHIEHLEIAAVIAVELGDTPAAEAAFEAWKTTDALEAVYRDAVKARLAMRLGHLNRAAAHLDQVRTALVGQQAPRLHALVEFIDALVSFYQGNHGRLEAQLRRLEDEKQLANTTIWTQARIVTHILRSEWSQASAVIDALQADNDYGVANMRAWIALQRGRTEEALAWLDGASGESVLFRDEVRWLRRLAALQAGRELPPPGPASACVTIRIAEDLLAGRIALDAGDGQRALSHVQAAQALVADHGIGIRAPDVALLRADIAARAGDTDQARHHLDLAERDLAHPHAPQARLIQAARMRIDGHALPSDLRAAWSALPDPEALAIASGEHACFAPPGAALLVGPDCAWFSAADERVDLSQRQSTRQLLEALVAARLEGGDSLDIAALAAAGWPGERMLPASAKNRVHVALTWLRKHGLGDWITRDNAGYRLHGRVLRAGLSGD